MAFLLKSYLRVLDRRPLLTQSLTAGILMATGDAIAQFGVDRKHVRDYQPERGIRFFLFGTCFAGPLLRGWYLLLDKYCLGTPKVAVIKKILVDQSVMAPVFLTVFLGTMEYWKSRSIKQAKSKIQAIWPAAQMINFYFIPLQHRIMYVQLVAIFWNTYLSWKSEAVTETQLDSALITASPQAVASKESEHQR